MCVFHLQERLEELEDGEVQVLFAAGVAVAHESRAHHLGREVGVPPQAVTCAEGMKYHSIAAVLMKASDKSSTNRCPNTGGNFLRGTQNSF